MGLLQSNLANYGATLLYNPGPDCAFAQDQLFLWRTLSQPVSLQSGPQGRLNQAHPAGSEQELRKCAVVLLLLYLFRKRLFCSWSFCFGLKKINFCIFLGAQLDCIKPHCRPPPQRSMKRKNSPVTNPNLYSQCCENKSPSN